MVNFVASLHFCKWIWDMFQVPGHLIRCWYMIKIIIMILDKVLQTFEKAKLGDTWDLAFWIIEFLSLEKTSKIIKSKLTPLCSATNCVPPSATSTHLLSHLQAWCLHHFPGQLVSKPAHPFNEGILPNVQHSSWCSLRHRTVAVGACLEACLPSVVPWDNYNGFS